MCLAVTLLTHPNYAPGHFEVFSDQSHERKQELYSVSIFRFCSKQYHNVLHTSLDSLNKLLKEPIETEELHVTH